MNIMKKAKYTFLDGFNKSEISILISVPILFVIFFVFRILSHNYFLADSYEYLDIGKKIFHFSIFNTNIDHKTLTRRPFIYPLFLALFYNFNHCCPIKKKPKSWLLSSNRKFVLQNTINDEQK